jgi:hypothetical protein
MCIGMKTMERFTFLIKKDQLNKEFIYFAHILDGIVEAGTLER